MVKRKLLFLVFLIKIINIYSEENITSYNNLTLAKNLTLDDIKYTTYYLFEKAKFINILLNLRRLKSNSELSIYFFSNTKKNFNYYLSIRDFKQSTISFKEEDVLTKTLNFSGGFLLQNSADYMTIKVNSSQINEFIITLDYVEYPGRQINGPNITNYKFLFNKNFTFYLENPGPKYDFIVLKNINTQVISYLHNHFELNIQYYNQSDYLLDSKNFVLEDRNISIIQFFLVEDTEYMLLNFKCTGNLAPETGYIFQFTLLEPNEIMEDSFYLPINDTYLKSLNMTPTYYYYNLQKYTVPQIVMRFNILMQNSNYYFLVLNNIFIWNNDTLNLKGVEPYVDSHMRVYFNETGYLAIIIDPSIISQSEVIKNNEYFIKYELINETNTRIYAGIPISGNQLAKDDYGLNTIFCGKMYENFLLKVQKIQGDFNIYYKESSIELDILDGFNETDKTDYNSYFEFPEEKEICIKIEGMEEYENSTSFSLYYYAPCKEKYAYTEPNNEIIYNLYINGNDSCYLDNIKNDFAKYYHLLFRLPLKASDNFTNEIEILVEEETSSYNFILNDEQRYKDFDIQEINKFSSLPENRTILDLFPILTQSDYILKIIESPGYYEEEISPIPTYSVINDFKLYYNIDFSQSRLSFQIYQFNPNIKNYRNIRVTMAMEGESQFLIYWKFYGKCEHPIFDGFTLKNPVIGPASVSKTFINDYHYGNIEKEDEVCFAVYYEDDYLLNLRENKFSLKIEYIDEVKIDNGLEVWEIVLIVVGCVLALGIIIFLIYWFVIRKKKKKGKGDSIMDIKAIELIK